MYPPYSLTFHDVGSFYDAQFSENSYIIAKGCSTLNSLLHHAMDDFLHGFLDFFLEVCLVFAWLS